MVKNYHIKPQHIKALKWTGDNIEVAKEFLGEAFLSNTEDQIIFHHNADFHSLTGLAMFATKGDYICTEDGVHFKRMKTKEFEEMYEEDKE